MAVTWDELKKEYSLEWLSDDKRRKAFGNYCPTKVANCSRCGDMINELEARAHQKQAVEDALLTLQNSSQDKWNNNKGDWSDIKFKLHWLTDQLIKHAFGHHSPSEVANSVRCFEMIETLPVKPHQRETLDNVLKTLQKPITQVVSPLQKSPKMNYVSSWIDVRTYLKKHYKTKYNSMSLLDKAKNEKMSFSKLFINRKLTNENQEFQNLVAEHKRVVILGPTGSGKSTFCKYLGREQDKWKTSFACVIVVELQQLPLSDQHNKTLGCREILDFLGLSPEISDFVCQGSRQVLWVFDSFDEVVYNSSSEFLTGIGKGLDWAPHLVVTSRKEMGFLVHNAIHVELSDFEEAAFSYIENFFEDQEKKIVVKTLLSNNPQISILASTPLMCEIICTVYQWLPSESLSLSALLEVVDGWLWSCTREEMCTRPRESRLLRHWGTLKEQAINLLKKIAEHQLCGDGVFELQIDTDVGNLLYQSHLTHEVGKIHNDKRKCELIHKILLEHYAAMALMDNWYDKVDQVTPEERMLLVFLANKLSEDKKENQQFFLADALDLFLRRIVTEEQSRETSKGKEKSDYFNVMYDCESDCVLYYEDKEEEEDSSNTLWWKRAVENGSGVAKLFLTHVNWDGNFAFKDLWKVIKSSDSYTFNAIRQLKPPPIELVKGKLQISSQKLDMSRQHDLGNGSYGTVIRCSWKNKEVAFKKLKFDPFDSIPFHQNEIDRPKDVIEFIKEAKLILSFEPHDNVHQALGFSVYPLGLVTELMSISLDKLLRKNQNFDDKTLIGFAVQIACGMGFLHRKDFLHCDLATRNVLVTENGECKITDFGLSKRAKFTQTPEGVVPHPNDKYYSSTFVQKALPLEWLAPESLTFLPQEKLVAWRNTFASDVWSFGVTLWEIFSFGATPYAEKLRDSRTQIEHFDMDCYNKVREGKLELGEPTKAKRVWKWVSGACLTLKPKKRVSFLKDPCDPSKKTIQYILGLIKGS